MPKLTIATADQVRAYVEAHDDGLPKLVDRVAEKLGISRRQMFVHLKEGVQIDVPETAQRLLDATGHEVVVKRKKKSK